MALTKAQIKDSPDIATDLPLNREQEAEYHDYYHWPYYWGGSSLAGAAYGVPVAAEAMVVGDTEVPPEDPRSQIPADRRDPELRSCRDLFGYEVRNGSESMGKVEGFYLNSGACDMAFAVIALPDGDKRVLLPVSLITHMGPPGETIEVAAMPEVLRGAPSFDAEAEISAEAVTRYFSHLVPSR